MREKFWQAFGMKAVLFGILALGTVTAAATVRDALATEFLGATPSAGPSIAATRTGQQSEEAILSPRLALTSTSSLQVDTELYAELAAANTAPSAAVEVPVPMDYPYTLPIGFSPDWTHVSLDGDISMQVLGESLPLPQTRQQLGAEYYEYSAYLYRQAAVQIRDTEMAGQLEQLSRTAETLGQRLQKAATLRFEGLPDESLKHLKVRGQLLGQLEELNTRSLRVTDLDQHGQAVYPQQPRRDAYQAGALIRQFQTELATLKALPAAQSYPQVMALVTHQAALMERLARNVELRWETVFHCDEPGQPTRTLRMKLFAAQSLKPEQVSLATAATLRERISLGHPVQ